jgi:integrase
MVLTELMIKRMRAPAGQRIEIADSLAPGLVLRISTSGAKSWSVKYKVPGEGGVTSTGRPKKGKSRRLTLGTWPAMSLSVARDAAATAGRQAAAGADPRRARQQSAGNSVAAVAATMMKQAKISSAPYMERVLRIHVMPTMGHRPIGDIAWSDIRLLLDDLIAQDKAGTAREVRKHLSRLLSWAADRGMIETHPMAGRRATDLQRTEEAGRSLSLEEARRVYRAAGTLGYPFGPLYQLLLLTGTRKSEWGEASWDEFQGREWVVSRSRYKSRRDHVVPLGDEAMAIIESLPRWNAGPYVFSATGGRSPVSGWSRAKSRLDSLAKVSGYRIHDLRVTVRTQLSALGVARDVAEAVLGHAQGGLVGTYNKHQYEVEKRAALKNWADILSRG